MDAALSSDDDKDDTAAANEFVNTPMIMMMIP